MANEVMQSLFGLTPGSVQQQIRKEQEDRARMFASRSQTPMAAYYAGRAIESGLGTPLFESQQDPRITKAQTLQTIIQRVKQYTDLATPEGLTELAKELNGDPEFTGMALALRQEAAKMQAESKKAALTEQLTLSQIEENKAQAKKAATPPPPKQLSREDRWTELETKRLGEGLTKEENNEYKALSRLLFKPEKGTEDTATARRWDLETKAAQTSLKAMNVDWTKPIPPNAIYMPGIADLYQKANRGPWSGGEAVMPTTKPAPTPAQALSQRDQQALAWANANPNDPRAAEIKRRLGVK